MCGYQHAEVFHVAFAQAEQGPSDDPQTGKSIAEI